MARGSAVLVNSGATAIAYSGSTVMGVVAQWGGGRGTLVLSGTNFGASMFLSTQSGDGTWVNVNGTTYSANQITAYDLPPGPYRMVSGSGTTAAISAILVPISYEG